APGVDRVGVRARPGLDPVEELEQQRALLGLLGHPAAASPSRITSSLSRKRSCTTCTARSTSAWRTTQEIRIDEVEMIPMLIPASASAPNMSAATPGWLFIPAPTSETLPISRSTA